MFKEIEECQGIENKVIDHMALHRNEITNEYEAMEHEDKPKAYNRKLKKKKSEEEIDLLQKKKPILPKKVNEVIASHFTHK